MIPKKYRIKPNDSWISIANAFGVNLDDLLYYNGIDPTSKEQLPIIQPGQKIYIKDPYKLKASRVKADAPKDLGEWGPEGRAKIEILANAVRQGEISFEDVPEIFKIPTYQRMITLGTDKASVPFNYGIDAAAMLINPVAYFATKGAQKSMAYGYDRLSGKNEYGWDDLGRYTPILGRENAKNNPGVTATVDMVLPMITTGAVMSGTTISPNVKVLPSDVKSTVGNIIGLNRMSLADIPVKGNVNIVPGKSGYNFASGIKGVAPVSTTIGNPSVGYRPIIKPQGTFTNNASFTQSITPELNPRFIPTLIESTPLTNLQYKGIGIPVLSKPFIGEIPVTITPAPERHIYEQQSFNRWQMPNPGETIVPFRPGTGRFTITGNAPISTTVNGQALTNESLNTWYDYMPRKAVYVPGAIQGTPSNIKSGLGIVYDSNNPGNLIIE